MSIQTIIDRAQQIEIDRRRMMAQTVSRSQRIKTSERSTVQPWKFKITPPASLDWAANRAAIEVITTYDRVEEYEISLNNNAGMNYITAYQGVCRPSQLDALTIHSTGTSTLTLTNLPTIGTTGTNNVVISSSTVLFAQGDIIQPENSRYPYAVTQTVVRGATTTTSVPLNRPIITSEGVSLLTQGLRVGNSATWRVIVSGLPTYSLLSMRRVQYNGDFELIERVV
jgi:hypothetical protein